MEKGREEKRGSFIALRRHQNVIGKHARGKRPERVGKPEHREYRVAASRAGIIPAPPAFRKDAFMADNSDRLAFAIDLGKRAGASALASFRKLETLTIEKKGHQDLVSEADRDTETFIRAEIARAYPDDAIVGEEHAPTPGTSGWTWVIDPIDGTVSFMHGVPVFGTLIGIEHEGVPVAGVINFPALDERAWGMAGAGAWHRIGTAAPQQAHVSQTASLKDAMVCTTSFDFFRNEPWEDAYVALAKASHRTRGWSDCHNELLLITGRIDAVVEPVLKPWDISAIIAVLHEAGGYFTDWHGEHPNCSCNSPGLASNHALHAPLIEVLAPHAPKRA